MLEMDRKLILTGRTTFENRLVRETFTDYDYGSGTTERLVAEAWHFPAVATNAIFKAYEREPKVAQIFANIQADGVGDNDAKMLYMLASLETWLNEKGHVFSGCAIHTDYLGFEGNDMTLIVIYFEDELELYRSIVEG